jgi:uncharacterized protein
MRMARLGAGIVALFCATLLFADVAIPPLNQRVTDLTGTLSGGAVARIEAKLADFETKKGAQIAVLIVPTTQPEEIEQYSLRVAEAWKLGRKGVYDNAYLVVAKNDRRVRIEVGRGLEGALTDVTSNRIIDETITPHFKANDYDGGVEAGVDQIISVVNGEPLPAPDKKWERHAGGSLSNLLPILLVVVVVAGGVLRSIFGRFLGSAATGGLAGFLAFLVSHFLPIGLGAGIVAFLFALLAGGSSRGWSSGSGWGGGFGGGGFGGGGFGGGGGGGGFSSGGGGGNAGGGASGSW